MQFLDQAKIFIKAGNGGRGALSFRREKFIEFGGPDGGNGGKGSSIIIQTNKNLNTLIDYRYQQHFKGIHGQPGEGGNRTGRSAPPIILQVPIGTQIFSEDKKILLHDLDCEEEIILLSGGDGGIGNASFKSSTNQTPHKTIPPQIGQEMWIWLILKLIADIGLVGLPNAGKSTFLSLVSNAKPKIANYPFTTLKPKLGVVQHYSSHFTVADIPGLIAGAADGHGLGHRFLKHIERCPIILHLLDASEKNITNHYNIICKELERFNHQLTKKQEIIILTKSDLCQDIENQKTLLQNITKNPIFSITHTNKKSLIPVLNYLSKILRCNK